MEYINPTDDEIKIAKTCKYYNKENSIKINYLNKLFKKPWGYEYLSYQNEKIGIWILHIYENLKTSLHCHFKKDTILLVLSGTLRIDLYNTYKILNECEMLYIPANTFHGIMSYVKEGVILEIEIYSENINYSDKEDLLRLKDVYNRDKNSYIGSVEEINLQDNNSVNFHINNKYKFGNTNIEIIKNIDIYNNEIDKNNSIILLNGIIYNNNILSEGSIINLNNPIHNLSKETIFMKISNNYKNDYKKIIYNKEHLKDLINIKDFNKIGLTSGCFDIMHYGHIDNLKKCKNNCDTLFVCLSSDKQIKELKGEKRPINNIFDRMNMLINLYFVDYIILYDEIDNNKEIELDNIMNILNPYYWFKGTDYNEENIRFKHPSLKNIMLHQNIPNKSTTKIIEKIIEK